MKRRKFIKLSGLASMAMLTNSCNRSEESLANSFEIDVESLHTIGHKLFSGFDFSKYPIEEKNTDFLIVGGGISGFSSLCKLKEKDAVLIEASSKPGGTSSYAVYRNVFFSLGAHYDVEYPNFYGSEVLSLLEKLQIISFNELLNKWEFKEKEYLIPNKNESITYYKNKIVEDPLNISEKEKEFSDLMQTFFGEMYLPTRLIDPKYHDLNSITFLEFLEQNQLTEKNLLEALDYQMIDDYGAGVEVVSALAGIHYFACRPYFTENPQIFSPPEGNYYFIRKMMNYCFDKEVILDSFLYKVNELESGFEAFVWNDMAKVSYKFKCNKIIYSGKKHALKYVYPNFKFDFHVNYAPWLVMNFILTDVGMNFQDKFWQNDIIGEENFMGYVDSRAQFDVASNQRVLTAYYCFKEEEREFLLNVYENPKAIVQNAIEIIEKYQNIKLKLIEKVQIKLMGHAMPIPKKDYLLKDMNDQKSNPNFILTGVDNHRLPLLFDAMDAGLNFKLD